jgi:glycosyltransferase involved in cell wall biosynthesis
VEAILGGWKRLTETRREIDLQRKTIQARRKISDRDLFCLQRDLPQVHIRHGLPELTWDLVQNHYKPLLMTAVDHTNQDPLRISLFIISNDTLDAHMAGPGLRYLEIARALSRDLDVSLACPGETSLQVPGVRLISYKIEEPNPLIRQAQASQIVLLSPLTLNKFPALIDLSAWLIIDLYDPFLFENLHYYLKEPVGIQEDLNRQSVDVLNRAISAGDFFLCGSERQRDLWMGFLAANGRISPSALQKDPSLRSLIDVVGIGFLDREPQGHPFLRGLHPAFSVESKIVLWGGGMWDWLDPLTLVQAWPEVLAQIPEARLVFLGRRHPNPLVPRHAVAAQTEELAERLGEKDRSIFFYDWLAYADREALLCEADVGVTLHPLHVETRYSIRTRVMDYFWARLPVLITEGDVTSGWVQEWGLGRVVPEKDPQAVAQALLDILSIPKQDWASCFTPLRERFAWPRVVDPLQRYCLENRHLPDRLAERRSRASQKRSSNWRISLARAHYLWRTEGPGSTFHRAWRYIQWRLSR